VAAEAEAASEPVELGAHAEAEPESEPASEPARWSWAADAAFERARERERAAQPAASRRRFWQRRKGDSDGFRFDRAQPRHVRVLPPEPPFDEQFPVDTIDPWEEDLDLSIEEPEGAVDDEPAREREAALDRREPS
jgi:hypothetical protein